MEKTNKIITTVEQIEFKISELSTKREELISKVKDIQDNCSHSIGVEVDKFYQYKAICLNCNKMFEDKDLEVLRNNFENTIDFGYITISYDSKAYDEKVYIAYQLLLEEREKNPNLSDSDIVKIINKKIHEEWYAINNKKQGFVKTIGKK